MRHNNQNGRAPVQPSHAVPFPLLFLREKDNQLRSRVSRDQQGSHVSALIVIPSAPVPLAQVLNVSRQAVSAENVTVAAQGATRSLIESGYTIFANLLRINIF